MAMFDIYDKLNPNYIPNNTSEQHDEGYTKLSDVIPCELYDSKQNFLGYGWNFGEQFSITLSVDDVIKVSENSLIFENANEEPNELTPAYILGQKAYNTADARSWTFVGRTNSLYIWVEDEYVIYSTSGTKTIKIQRDLTDQHVELNILNFRREVVYTQLGETGDSDIVLNVDEDMLSILTPGLYYADIKICSDEETRVKSELIFIIS